MQTTGITNTIQTLTSDTIAFIRTEVAITRQATPTIILFKNKKKTKWKTVIYVKERENK